MAPILWIVSPCYKDADTICHSVPVLTDKLVTLRQAIMKDIHRIEQQTDTPYTVVGQNATWLLLATKRQPAIFTSWYVQSDIHTFEIYYEKTGIIPSAVYFPWMDFHTKGDSESDYVYKKKDFDYFMNLFDGTIEKGQAGYIFWVNS